MLAMNQVTSAVRAHYEGSGLVDRIKAALSSIGAGERPLTVTELAPMDQFHTRGMLATIDLANAMHLVPSNRVLDVGCGIGGPARYLAATYGCSVVGIDLSPSFIEAATYLTARCGLAERVAFHVGDALHIPRDAGEPHAFDAIFLQHVAMNIEDRAALYAEIRRVLAPGGRFATYDLVLLDGEVLYPAPWARDASTSFLRSEADTRAALAQAGFEVVLWRDDTRTALDWFAEMRKSGAAGSPAQSGLSLGTVVGPDVATMVANLGTNLAEKRLGVLSAVLTVR